MAILESQKRANVNPHMDPKFEPRVGEKERAEELGIEEPSVVLQSIEEQKQIQNSIDADLLKEKKIQFYKSMAEHEPDVWALMKQNATQGKGFTIPQDQWEEVMKRMSVDDLQNLRMISSMQVGDKELGFDYTTGVGAPVNEGTKFSRFTLSRLDTNIEKEDFLNLTVGPDGWTTDSLGRYALNAKGLEVLGLPPLKEGEKGRVIDEYQGFTKYDWVDAAPKIIQVAPSIATSIVLNPYGTTIGLLGGAVTMAGAYGIDEVIEYSQGWSNQSAGSMAAHASEEAMYGILGEWFGRALRPFGRMISDPQGGGFFGFKLRPNAPFTRQGVLTKYPNLEQDIRVMYGTRADGSPLPEVEVQKLIDKTIKHLRFKTPLTGDPSIPGVGAVPGTFDPINPNSLVMAAKPERQREIIKQILEGNGTYAGIPSISVATDRALIGRFQGVLNRVFNNSTDDVNRRYLGHTMLLLRGKAAGISDDLLKTYAAKLGTAEEGEILKELQEQILKRVIDDKTSYEQTLKMITENIEKETLAAIKAIRNQTGLLSDDLSESIFKRLQQVKASNDDAIMSFGADLDDAMGGQPIMSTLAIKDIINNMAEFLPKTTTQGTKTIPAGPAGASVEIPTNITDFAKLPYMDQVTELVTRINALGDRVTAKEMISLEKMFTFMKGDIAKQNSLITPTQIDSLIKAAQNSFVNAEGIITNNISKLSAAEKAKLGKPINLLKNLNTLRTETQGMFDDVFTASMIKQAESGATGFIEADKVVKHFVIGGRHKELLRLINALPQSERAIFTSAIARETFDNALNTSKNNITGNYDGKAFLNHWMAIGDDTKTTLFGSNKVQIERLAKDIAAKNGKFSEAETRALLNSDESQLIKLLNEKNALIAKNDELFSQGWLKKLAGNEAEQEQVVDYIFRPKSANRINQAKAYFGSEGAAGNTTDGFNVGGFNKVREAAMMKILQDIGTEEAGIGVIFNGTKFKNVLNSYGNETLDAMFGKTLRKELFDFANQVEILTSKNKAGGLVAANVALAPVTKGVSAFPFMAKLKIAASLINKPGFIKYLTEGIKNPYIRKGSDAFGKVSTYFSAAGVPEKIIQSEGRQDEDNPKSMMEKMKDVTLPIPFDGRNNNIIDTIIPDKEEIPVSMNTINPASRLSNVNMAQPITNTGPINPNTMARGQQLFNRPGEITFASKGGIMSTNKAFQRVA
tara:strand:+ start:1202 stop:4798 length:3597 start_codon:yes stop_codon:yes gene_type:complete